jgi:hypothetical protein
VVLESWSNAGIGADSMGSRLAEYITPGLIDLAHNVEYAQAVAPQHSGAGLSIAVPNKEHVVITPSRVESLATH